MVEDHLFKLHVQAKIFFPLIKKEWVMDVEGMGLPLLSQFALRMFIPQCLCVLDARERGQENKTIPLMGMS